MTAARRTESEVVRKEQIGRMLDDKGDEIRGELNVGLLMP